MNLSYYQIHYKKIKNLVIISKQLRGNDNHIFMHLHMV
jgi:hypothetical protein